MQSDARQRYDARTMLAFNRQRSPGSHAANIRLASAVFSDRSASTSAVKSCSRPRFGMVPGAAVRDVLANSPVDKLTHPSPSCHATRGCLQRKNG